MNTVKSVYYGWATLIAAGGGAYYFAKKSINADRAQKAEADRAKRARLFELEKVHGVHYTTNTASNTALNATSSNPSISPNAVVSSSTTAARAGGGTAQGVRREDRVARDQEAGQSPSPSLQASLDPAATRHASPVEGAEKSKYEASDVYRSRKGDRFS
ncbi:hypothetical protein EKO04_010916 [Ascochyta lentis]|uniref:Uncharacterized protein n=1 Tax=Ascochyta lentis TaxID=205686 RepID=A0A8H7IW79_9PLEO|nr:hypothetical protein EKO04_010916 [Ascochyta lentis]